MDMVLFGTGLAELIAGKIIDEKRIRDQKGRILTTERAAKLLKWSRALTGLGLAQIAAEYGITLIDNYYCGSDYGSRPFWWWD